MGLRTSKKKAAQPTAKLRRHAKIVVLRMEIGKDLLREKAAPEIVGQMAARHIAEFIAREGLNGQRGDSADTATR